MAVAALFASGSTFLEEVEMKSNTVGLTLTGLALWIAAAAPSAAGAPQSDAKRWTEKFNLPACSWASTGRNEYFVLEPGYRQVFEGREGKDAVHLEITVLDQTKKIGNVEARVVEEKESKNGQIVEISRNFYALCTATSDVFYFGEEVDIYKNGKLDNHEGAWIAEQGGARAGLFMPSRPLIGARFYQEIAPSVAMDRVEIVSDSESLKTPAGEFHDCVKTEETSPLTPATRDYKVYARGIGLVQDGVLLLSGH
jgi:hypothetical protein